MLFGVMIGCYHVRFFVDWNLWMFRGLSKQSGKQPDSTWQNLVINPENNYLTLKWYWWKQFGCG